MLASLRHSPGHALRRRVTLVLGVLLLSVGVASQPAHAEDPVDVETATAINLTMDYWASAMPNQFYLEWFPPGLGDWGYGYNSLYDGTSTTIYCGDTLLETDNAYACESDTDNWVAFDTTFMNRSQELGDAFIYVIVAHEFGHVAQAHLAPDQIWAAKELQADCFAGSTMAGMVNDGTLQLDDADYYEIDEAFRSIETLPWGEGGTHGSWEQRTAAFNLGWTGGGDSRVCLPSS
jgi:predicted metalloprotease